MAPSIRAFGLRAAAACVFLVTSCAAFAGPDTTAPKPGEPTDPKARKTYAEAFEWMHQRHLSSAIDSFRKANKQDGGHCLECLKHAFDLALSIGANKDAEEIARDWAPLAQTSSEKAALHYRIGITLVQEGLEEHKDKPFSDAASEFRSALEFEPQLSTAHYWLGISLAHMQQDDAARAEFTTFQSQDKLTPALHERAARFIDRIELARARMAPAFSITTMDGQHISMDGLAGKVVLIDFWATWCGPCREALPHIREIAHRFEGQPFVVLSVSVDKDAGKWHDFVGKNGMTWLQYCDGSFDGDLAKKFGIHAIPATFTIDADGVLEDQHVGDSDIEGKIRKLIARANDLAAHSASQPAAK